MTNLECKVTSCAHYQMGCCSLQGIHVGSSANCASYQKRQGAAPSNCAGTCASSTASVQCDAHKCCHNAQGQCGAQSICVANAGSSGTECSTFSSR